MLKPQDVRGGWGVCKREELIALDVRLLKLVLSKLAYEGEVINSFLPEMGEWGK